jgi:SAM-dependent methyltransferase
MNNRIINKTSFLDEGVYKLQQGQNIPETMDMIFSELHQIRQDVPMEVWRQFVSQECRQHPLMDLVLQDPLSWRIFAKPRGYAGDAIMLDFIYAVDDGVTPPAVAASSELGKRIYAYTSRAEAAQAVRSRRHLISDQLNELAATKPGAHVLSLACGHLREAQLSSAVLQGQLGRYVAIDQDPESIALVEREMGHLGIETLVGSVRDILQGRLALSDFDFVYAAGLYDYLPLPVAQRLSERLFRMLNPGGRLLLANFIPNISNVGFMEAFLDWWLIYRTRAELLQVADTVPDKQLETMHIFMDENINIAFLEIERKG